jgi:hypothetical protein
MDVEEYAASIFRVDDEKSTSPVKMGGYMSPEILTFT